MDELTRLFVTGRDGDRGALEHFLRAVQPDVWRFCAMFVGPEDADDATQETFVRAWRAAATFRGESSAKTWLLAIARRTCFEATRTRSRRPVPSAEVGELPTGDPSGRVDLEDLLWRLTPERRAAVVLTQLIGLSYEEAAEACGCPVGTIRSRVARARRDMLDAQSGTPSVRRDRRAH